jgi:hypothetical protein
MVTPWIQLIENPRALDGVYENAPSLDGARLMELAFTLNGLALTLDLQAPPTRRSRRTPEGANRVQVRLEGAPLLGVAITALAPFESMTLSLLRDADGLLISSAAGPNIFSLRCGALRIAKAGSYVDTSVAGP